jgi:hypothetical protein
VQRRPKLPSCPLGRATFGLLVARARQRLHACRKKRSPPPPRRIPRGSAQAEAGAVGKGTHSTASVSDEAQRALAMIRGMHGDVPPVRSDGGEARPAAGGVAPTKVPSLQHTPYHTARNL